MSIKDYIPIILGVIKDFRVIGTVVAMIIVIEFAKYVTTYRKKPPKPKKSKVVAAPAPAKPEEKKEGESTEEKTEESSDESAE